ncbi:hypothetical protein Cgig2_021142 [Carnegiea gigantea]|uniref:Spen paralogue and orthologue SPOC C-terminal domain-containing protein n=1 Tax=Carnegiea gigantea TaxID=171969 RepID=A0A9Q1KX32_9CARY|nr:hypothetical protein Cgig2_021142 [Carnegiea gigantea]
MEKMNAIRSSEVGRSAADDIKQTGKQRLHWSSRINRPNSLYTAQLDLTLWPYAARGPDFLQAQNKAQNKTTVMSFCCKEGLSGAGFKCMKEVAEKYKERKKVGFAQLSNGLDLYICPHSDAVITILAKHGFFKGMAAVRDKSDPLIGCVVWRKNPSSVPALKALEVNTPQSSSEPSVKSPSGSSALQVPSESSTMANKSQESISLSSSVGAQTSKGDEPPGFETNMELEKFNLQPPTVVAENSAASSDDDDLPEYDFGAVVSQSSRNQTTDVGAIQSGFAVEKFGDSDVPRPLSNLTRSESSTLSRTSPDFHFQGLVSQGMGHQSSHSPRLLIEPQKQVRECKERSKLPDNYSEGPVPHNLEHMHELQNSSLPVGQEKQTEKSPTSSKSGTLFNDDDDDDIPEWCPPGFTKPGLEVSQGAGPSFTLSHSKVPDSGFADSNSGPLLPWPPTPPPAQLHVRGKEYPLAPQLLTSIAGRPSADGFVHNPDFARNPASRPRFGPKDIGNQVHHLAWRSSRP